MNKFVAFVVLLVLFFVGIILVLELYVGPNITAEYGDTVVISYEGFDSDGEIYEDEVSEERSVLIGSETMLSDVEDALIGTQVEDEIVVETQYPEDYYVEDLQGREVTYEIEITNIYRCTGIGSAEDVCF